MQTFTAPLNTTYKIECWGASGGNSYIDPDQEIYNTSRYGGKGGYCAGKITLPYNISLYVYVGQSGGNIKGVISFNGGGAFFAPWNIPMDRVFPPMRRIIQYFVDNYSNMPIAQAADWDRYPEIVD